MKLVLDNSVAMRWLFADGSQADRQYANEVAALVETADVHVPALFVTEAANVISRALKAGVINVQESQSRFDLLNAMQVLPVNSKFPTLRSPFKSNWSAAISRGRLCLHSENSRCTKALYCSGFARL